MSSESQVAVRDVSTAAWLAAAVLTYLRAGDPEQAPFPEHSFALKQAEIQRVAQGLCARGVHNARVSQWCNGDHAQSTHRYLRPIGSGRRLTAPGEFSGDREQDVHAHSCSLAVISAAGKKLKDVVIETSGHAAGAGPGSRRLSAPTSSSPAVAIRSKAAPVWPIPSSGSVRTRVDRAAPIQ